MDTLVKTAEERKWNPDAYARDQWVKSYAAKMPKGSWVLDAGAGASKYSEFFQHCKYQTQDFCEYKGDLVQYSKPIDYVCDIVSIPLPSGSLDMILCTEVFEHVVDPVPVLAEFGRLLKPGGLLLLTAPLVSGLHMEPYHYFSGFTHYWYEHWLPRSGFEVESVTPVGGPARCFTFFGQMFYREWGKKEKQLPPLKRGFSLGVRAIAKVGLHYVLPALSPKLDTWLGTGVICAGYMVAGRRCSSPNV